MLWCGCCLRLDTSIVGLVWFEMHSELLVAQTSSVSRCGKKFPVLIDILGSFCSVGISRLDLSSHMLQVNCGGFLPRVCLLSFGIWFST